MGHPLMGKDLVIEYMTSDGQLGKKTFKECIQLGLPCFKIGGRLMSHTDAIDQWFIARAMQRYGIKNEADLDEEGEK
jgi:hypothetical protein